MAERDLRPLAPAARTFASTLLRLGDQHYVWRLALHRLIADSCSLALIYRYTAEAYAAAAEGRLIHCDRCRLLKSTHAMIGRIRT